MEVSSISRSVYQKNNLDKANPSFKASVKLGSFNSTGEEMLSTAKKIVPKLEKLDNNLFITVTDAVKQCENFFDVVKAFFQKPTVGLKFDIQYIDPRKAINKILSANSEEQLLMESTVKALKGGSKRLEKQITFPLKVGAYRLPQQTEAQYIDSTVSMVKKEVNTMPSSLLDVQTIQRIFSGGSYEKTEAMNARSLKYKGIDF